MKPYLILAILFILQSCDQKNEKQNNYPQGTFSSDTAGDKIYTTDLGDTGMNNAINTAKQDLYLFDQALKSGNKDLEYFNLKKRFTSGESGEHIWIRDIQFYEAGYKGIVNNDPIIVTGIKLGDTVYVDRKDISDWMYLDKNILCGGYTLRLELKRMTPDEKAALLRNLDYEIKE